MLLTLIFWLIPITSLRNFFSGEIDESFLELKREEKIDEISLMVKSKKSKFIKHLMIVKEICLIIVYFRAF